MNWSGYVIGFNTDEELDKIVEICKAHNDYDPDEHSDDEDEQIGIDTHGGTLQNFATAVFKEGKGYKPKGIYKQISTCTRVLICGNYEGRLGTENFFEKNGLQPYALDSGMSARLTGHENIDHRFKKPEPEKPELPIMPEPEKPAVEIEIDAIPLKKKRIFVTNRKMKLAISDINEEPPKQLPEEPVAEEPPQEPSPIQ